MIKNIIKLFKKNKFINNELNQKKINFSKLAIFNTFKTNNQKLTGEAIRQREIIMILAAQENSNERTRGSISRRIAKKRKLIWKNLYSGIFRDLDEALIPLKLVEEEGRGELKRGPKALQEKGMPYYKLTQSGLLVALSIEEIENKYILLNKFFTYLNPQEKEFQEIILKLSKIAPKFTFSLFEKYIKAFCKGKLKNLLPFNSSNLKNISDKNSQIQKEILKISLNLSETDKEKIMNLL